MWSKIKKWIIDFLFGKSKDTDKGYSKPGYVKEGYTKKQD